MSLLIIGSLLLISCETQSDYSSNADSLSPQATLTRESDNALTLPPGMNNGENSPRQKLEGLKGLKGVNVDQLFSENIRDTDRRFDRLENVVQEFRREYESVKPEIIRLVAIEKDMQKLIELLNNDVGLPANSPGFASYEDDPLATEPLDLAQNEENMAESMTVQASPPAPVPQPAPVAPPQPAPQVQAPAAPTPTPVKPAVQSETVTGGLSLTNFRFGEHPDYTRLVIDASGKTPYMVDMDPSGEILKVTIPKAAWTGATTKNYPSNALLQSYSVQKDAQTGDTLLYISFKKSVNVVNQGTLTKDSAPRFRIFIDIRS